MDVYLAHGGEMYCSYILPRCIEERNMDLYLAEGGSLYKGYLYPAYTKREREMNIYLAGTEGGCGRYVSEGFAHSTPLKGVKILHSYYYCNDFVESIIIPSVKKFMLDSGAFTFMARQKGVTDWDKYLEDYATFINKHNVDLFFELDIDSLVGYGKVKEYRRKLERLTGKSCIPVWHKSRGRKEFVRMCKEYDYVSIGGIVSKEISREEWKYFPYFIDMAHKHGCKIHGLGFTSVANLPKYHFDSVDSTAWTSGNRFGRMYRFNGRTMDVFTRTGTQRLADQRNTAIHNFTEWVKFQKYAEKHL